MDQKNQEFVCPVVKAMSLIKEDGLFLLFIH
jgi:hypothetical protein